jgi:tRNA threonylcarbamoyladenosine biosynthesis protein TsaB
MLILNIDTATEHASICVSRNADVVGLLASTEQKNHASFVQPAIESLMVKNGLSLSDIDAVAVTIGPGSYTGLRVGLASAKGICYALGKPLITVNTLQAMAQAAVDEYLKNTQPPDERVLFCPLIDARRMEVFTAIYNISLGELTPSHALVIDQDSFKSLYNSSPVVFSGSGAPKLEQALTGVNIHYSRVQHNASHMVKLAGKAFTGGFFADLAYSAPLYVKEFFDTSKQNS